MSEQKTERPILFSGAMVLAILKGQKTQTRRALKVQPIPDPHNFQYCKSGYGTAVPDHSFIPTSASGKVGIFEPQFYECPYGTVGDRLWVREAWQAWAEYDGLKPSEIPENPNAIIHNASREGFPWESRKRPGMFMPRWASRILLEIVSVRVERLQSISESDARAEGIRPNWVNDLTGFNPDEHGYLLADYKDGDDDKDEAAYFYTGKQAFESLWDSINGDSLGKAWADNPFVWVVEFKAVEPS